MKKKGYFRSVIDAIKDPEREFIERVYLALTIASELACFIALIGDLLMGEHPAEDVVLIGTLVFVPTIAYICLRKDKIRFAIRFTVISLFGIIMPTLFFYGGGLEGGGVIWFIFAYTYMGLVLTGAWRTVMFILLFIMTCGCYLAEYFHPELVHVHDRDLFFADSFLSIILVGFVCYVMTRLQNRLFMSENARAREAAERAEELTRSQNRFFSSMSHEIRTPINSILGLNELILRDQDASDEIIREASGIRGSGKMLLSLINDILDFSKMEAGSMDIVPVDYRIGDMLSEIVNMIWIRANDKGLQFHVSVDPTVPTVLYGDEVRIKQVIINLLNNAVKYTAEGSVDLHIENGRVDENSVELSISITDTGMGIKKEALPYLFDAFKRVDEEKNRHIEGTGLGLSIVKQLVDLMGGNIKVSSVYGEGSTFTVVVRQGISDSAQIGELNIHNQSVSRRSAYECSFRAPDARILIVDDNEMNLEVESKLLADTEMTIDRAISGMEALKLALSNHYDTILMDHLMPEMDGIECLKKLRVQIGGLNCATPVVVLTANAGSENKELYNRAGFDGYLVKPVSGEALEDMLVKHISSDKLIMNSNKMLNMREDINASAGYLGKAPVVITSTSMCDLPAGLIKKLNIPIMPHLIRTDEGVFKDGVQMDADEMIRYLSTGKEAVSLPPDESSYTDFFASVLKRAHHLIHISITSSMSEEFQTASEAAGAFDNVTVINSECLSSATGILVLIACRLAQMNSSVEEIVAELEQVKHRLMCSFVIDTTDYMMRNGLISMSVHKLARSLNMHPCVRIRGDRSGIGGVWFGSRRWAYKRYITKAFPVDVNPDPDIAFVTYVDVPNETLLEIKEEISKLAYFQNVVFKQASAAISSNCGPGTFGILYFVKSNKSYNIASYFDTEEEYPEDETEASQETAASHASQETEGGSKEPSMTEENSGHSSVEKEQGSEAVLWYEGLEGIDGKMAIGFSGSEDAFRTVLKIFYDSIGNKSEEIEGFYSSEDWDNYTIKVHALKSSAKLIGAMDTAEKAQRLETAGKEGDTRYIRDNHAAFMEEYRRYKDTLSAVFEEEKGEGEEEEKPMAEEWLLASVYEGLLEAAEMMDLDAMEEILQELEPYSVPEEEREKIRAIRELADSFEYDGIVELLQGGGTE